MLLLRINATFCYVHAVIAQFLLPERVKPATGVTVNGTDSKLRAHFFIIVKSSWLFLEVDIKIFKCFQVI